MNNNKGQHTRPAAVAYLMSRFPRITETFILREMLELEREGQPVVIFPLLRVQQPVRHHETELLRDRVHYTPFISLPILAANFYFLRRAPLRYLKLWWSVLKGNLGSANLFFGALGIFPKSVYFAKLIEKLNVGHVHAHFATHPALAALIISELSGVNFSFTVHAHDIFVHRAMLGEKLKKARFVIAISEFNRRYLLKLFPALDAEKIKIVRCGIKPENYDFEKDSSAVDESNEFNILCVASLQPYKGIEHLIRACASLRERIPNLRCTVIGEGEDRKMLESLIARLDLQDTVRLVGARPQNEVAEHLKRAQLFVLPSVVAADGQMEGIPVALMEAMASRLPVVSTVLSGIPELVTDGEHGRLVPPGDSAALAEAILLLHEQPALRRAMGEAGRAKVEREFELRRNVRKLKALFDESLEEKSDEFSAVANRRAFPEPETLREVKDHLRSALPANGETEITFHGATLNEGHDSAVYELTVSAAGAAPRGVVLKLHRPARQKLGTKVAALGKTHAENEFRALSALWSDFGAAGGQFRVPEPLALIPEQSALVTEKCEGERFDALLRRRAFGKGAISADRIVELSESCGEWLARFHAVTRGGKDKSPIVERLRRDFDADLRACRNFGFDSRVLDRAAQYFEAHARLIEKAGGFVVSQHCDFGPHNIFVKDKTVTVIDFEGMQDGLIYDDLAYFLCLVETMPFYRLRSALKARIRAAFLNGYGALGSFDARLLEFYELPVTIKIAAHNPAFTARDGKLQSLLRRWLRKRVYTKRLEARVK